MIKSKEDYFDEMYDKFPDVSKEDVRHAIGVGEKRFIDFSFRCGVNLKSKNDDKCFSVYDMPNSNHNWAKDEITYRKRLARKIMMLMGYNNEPIDRNSFFISINHKQYSDLMYGLIDFATMYVYNNPICAILDKSNNDIILECPNDEYKWNARRKFIRYGVDEFPAHIKRMDTGFIDVNLVLSNDKNRSVIGYEKLIKKKF